MGDPNVHYRPRVDEKDADAAHLLKMHAIRFIDPLLELSEREREALRSSPPVQMSDLLPKFLLATDWTNAEETERAMLLMTTKWKRPTDMSTILRMLGPEFSDSRVRDYAVECIRRNDAAVTRAASHMTRSLSQVSDADSSELGGSGKRTDAEMERAALDEEGAGISAEDMPDELEMFLPQAVQALKAEQWPPASALAHLLVERGLRKPRTFGLTLFWLLQVEISRAQDDADAMQQIQALLTNCLGDGDLGHQFNQQNALWSKTGFFARVVDTYMGRRDTAILPADGEGEEEEEEEEDEEEREDKRVMRRASFVGADAAAAALGMFAEEKELALAAADADAAAATATDAASGDESAAPVASVDAAASAAAADAPVDDAEKTSATAGGAANPFDARESFARSPSKVLHRSTVVPGGERVLCIYKVGDDLRQDCLVMQLLQIFDSYWLAGGLDLPMTPYDCVSSWDDGGLIHVVPDSKTLAKIQADPRWGGGGAGALNVGAFSSRPLREYLRAKNPKPEKFHAACDQFTRSLAGYCVATLIMGIGTWFSFFSLYIICVCAHVFRLVRFLVNFSLLLLLLLCLLLLCLLLLLSQAIGTTITSWSRRPGVSSILILGTFSAARKPLARANGLLNGSTVVSSSLERWQLWSRKLIQRGLSTSSRSASLPLTSSAPMRKLL